MVIGALGILMGLLLGVIGASGVILCVPLLILCANLPFEQAAPVAFLGIAIAAFCSAAFDVKSGAVHLRTALLIGLIGAVTAPVGEILGGHLNKLSLNLVFAVLLLVVGYINFAQSKGSARSAAGQITAGAGEDGPANVLLGKRPVTFVMYGSVAGMLSGILGVGGVFVVSPALRRHSNLSASSISATCFGAITIIAGAAAATSIVGGKMNFPVALPFASFAVVGLAAGRAMRWRLNGFSFQKYSVPLFAVVAGAMVAINFV